MTCGEYLLRPAARSGTTSVRTLSASRNTLSVHTLSANRSTTSDHTASANRNTLSDHTLSAYRSTMFGHTLSVIRSTISDHTFCLVSYMWFVSSPLLKQNMSCGSERHSFNYCRMVFEKRISFALAINKVRCRNRSQS